MTDHGPAAAPCRSCPYRRDVPSGVWAIEEYDQLPAYDAADTGSQPPGAFFCHQQTGRLCAGWVGCHDMQENLGLRLAVLVGLLDTDDYEAALDYVSPVPLWPSGTAAAEHGKRDIEHPQPEAHRTINHLTRKQRSKAV